MPPKPSKKRKAQPLESNNHEKQPRISDEVSHASKQSSVDEEYLFLINNNPALVINLESIQFQAQTRFDVTLKLISEGRISKGCLEEYKKLLELGIERTKELRSKGVIPELIRPLSEMFIKKQDCVNKNPPKGAIQKIQKLIEELQSHKIIEEKSTPLTTLELIKIQAEIIQNGIEVACNSIKTEMAVVNSMQQFAASRSIFLPEIKPSISIDNSPYIEDEPVHFVLPIPQSDELGSLVKERIPLTLKMIKNATPYSVAPKFAELQGKPHIAITGTPLSLFPKNQVSSLSSANAAELSIIKPSS